MTEDIRKKDEEEEKKTKKKKKKRFEVEKKEVVQFLFRQTS